MSNFSSSQPNSEHLEELMAGYVLNALSPAENTEFEDYLQADPEIFQQLEQLQEVMGLMAYAAPKMTPPPHLLNNILEAAKVSSSVAPVKHQKQIFWRKLAVIVAAIAALGLVIDNYLLRQRLAFIEATVHTLKEAETRGFAMKGINVSNSNNIAFGSVVLDLENGKAVIAMENLPALPQGESYMLWAFTEKKKIFCGQFNTNNSGQFIQEVPIPIKEYDSPVILMEISRESSVIPPASTKTTPIMTSES